MPSGSSDSDSSSDSSDSLESSGSNGSIDSSDSDSSGGGGSGSGSSESGSNGSSGSASESDSSESSDSSSSSGSSCPTASFAVQAGKINDGFDPVRLPGDPEDAPPWASVWVGYTNEVVKLVISPAESADEVELQVTEGDGFFSISPADNFTEAETNLTLNGFGVTEIVEAR